MINNLVKQEETVLMPTAYGDFEMTAFTQLDTKEAHIALRKGNWTADEPVLIRLHSSCVTGDIFGSQRCDCGEQLHAAMQMIENQGKGLILYLIQEGRGIGLANKLKAYKLQEQGLDTVEANLQLGFKEDERDYSAAAEILKTLNVKNIRLISNNPEKLTQLTALGFNVVERVSIEIAPNKNNERYLLTKRDKMQHFILKP
jgi:3,4-dihydroxy 2-butanone 4-phosphate synthase / GTP cyclohydrolase II